MALETTLLPIYPCIKNFFNCPVAWPLSIIFCLTDSLCEMKKKNKLKSYRYRSNAIVRLNAYFTFGNSIRKDAPKVEASEGEFEMSSNATDGSEEICVFLPHSLIQAEYR